MDNLTKSLAAIQSRLTVPKPRHNEFGGFHYRNLEDILQAVKPLLAEYGLNLFFTDDVLELGGEVYVKSTATITDGQNRDSVSAFAREEKARPKMAPGQLTGAASSYARKYAVQGLLCIDEGVDLDVMNNKPAKPTTRTKRNPSAPNPAKPETLPVLNLDTNELAAQAVDKWLDDGITSGQILRKLAAKYQIPANEKATIQALVAARDITE